MEGSGSSISQIIAQVGSAVEETLEEVPQPTELVVNLMNTPVVALP